MFGPQSGLGRPCYIRAVQESLIGCLGFFLIAAGGFTAFLLPLEQFESGFEVVGEQTPFLCLQVVH